MPGYRKCTKTPCHWAQKASLLLINILNSLRYANYRSADTCSCGSSITSLAHNKQIKPSNIISEYSGIPRPMTWLKMPRLHASPGRQRHWYWNCLINVSYFTIYWPFMREIYRWTFRRNFPQTGPEMWISNIFVAERAINRRWYTKAN